MAKAKKVTQPKLAYRYVCPACTGNAIETSNKMLGVEVDCANCQTRIKLDDAKRYIKI